MDTKNNQKEFELRRLAEKTLEETADNDYLSEKTPEDIASLIHELEVHQIELEMQNEELGRIQGELEKTRDKYSHLYDFAPVGYFTLSEKGSIEEANLTISSMIGVDRSDLIGKPFTRFVLREDQDIFYKHRQRLLETETAQPCELQLIKNGGHAFYVRMECMVIRNEGEEFRQIRTAVSDINERKKSEKEKDKLQAQLSSALEISHLGHWEYDVADDRFTLNDHFYNIFRTTANQVGGYTMSSSEYARRFVHPYDIAVVGEEIRKAIETDDPHFSRQLEHRMLYADGTVGYISVRFFIVKDSQGKTIKTYGVNQDITERKMAEDALRNRADRRQREADVVAAIASSENQAKGFVSELTVELTEAASRAIGTERVGVWFFEENGTRLVNIDNYESIRQTHSSGAILQEHEYRNELAALKNAKYVDAYDPLTDPRTAGYAEDYLKPNRITSMLDAIIRSGGRNIGVLCFEHVDKQHRWEDDEITFACQLSNQVALSISNREGKQAEKEREKLQEQLNQAQKMESIGNLAGGIAHDFNNILSSIIGYTELALDEVEKDTSIEDDLQEVYHAGNRARDLVKQILTFARQSDEKLKPIQIDIIVQEVLKFIRASIPTTIEIKQNIESESLIMGSSTQAHQILMNLCTNAAYAMENEGGTLEVNLQDITVDRSTNWELPGLKFGDYIEMKVSDTGTGIQPEILKNIFDPYFTTKGPGEGTGMGLAMVHGIVDSYGGKIMVDSILGKGTVFTIYLPIARKRGDHRAYESGALPSGTERVLFVDDEASIAKMGGQILERLGYRVNVRTSSVDALELFRSKPDDFDLVISDMTMPTMTGDKLAMELIASRSDIPVILCTGYSKKISDEIASNIGIKAFAYKPIVKADLAKTVRKVLDEAKGASDA